MGLQKARSPIIAFNVLLCTKTLHVKKYTDFTEAFFTSTASSCHNTHVDVILQTPTIRALPALRRFSQNSRTTHAVCADVFFFFRIYSNSDGGGGGRRRVNMKV